MTLFVEEKTELTSNISKTVLETNQL